MQERLKLLTMDKRTLEQELLSERRKKEEMADWLEDEKKQHKQTADQYATSQERHKQDSARLMAHPPYETYTRDQAYSPTRASAQNMRQFIGSNSPSPRGRTGDTSREREDRAAIVAAHEDEADNGYQKMDLGSQGKRYLHELKEVKIGKFPTVSGLDDWKFDLITNVNMTSARTDNATVCWVKEVDESWANNEYLRDSGVQWYTLDNKLACALLAVLPMALKRKIKVEQKKEMNQHNHTLNGRQILYHIYQFLRTNSTMHNFFNVEDLQMLTYPGDDPDKVELFMNNWVETTEGMRTSIDEKELAELLYKRLKDSKALAHEVKLFNIASHKTPYECEHTQTHLLEAMENYISDHREQINRTQRFQAQQAKASTYNANPATNARKQGGTAPVASAMGDAASHSTGGRQSQNHTQQNNAMAEQERESYIIQVWSAYSVGKATMEYRDVNLKGLKGGKICIAHITHGCSLGDACPNHHTKNRHICIGYQTTTGCIKKKCDFAHEDVGKTAAIALMNWANQKSLAGTTGGRSKGKGKGDERRPTSPGGKGREKGKGDSGERALSPMAPGSRSHQKCRHFMSNPSSCTRGDQCAFSHE